MISALQRVFGRPIYAYIVKVVEVGRSASASGAGYLCVRRLFIIFDFHYHPLT